ncbi:MAG: branched-chain amino acid ABC transporter permease [Thermodesulfobacteriota bacterium]|nr:branched-chain amino acid ABC transporter permease [Thermodesulfobacteriota bacterium]
MFKNRSFKSFSIIILVLFFFSVPLLTDDPYYLHILIMVILHITLALGLRLILISGHISIAHAGFMGIGAYTSALLVVKAGFSFWTALFLSGLCSALFAMVIGRLILRVTGIYFGIITMALGEILRLIWMRWKDLFGGATGILNIPPPSPIHVPWIARIEFTSKIPYYYLALVIVLITIYVMHRIDRSRFGMTLFALNDKETLAESLGVDTMLYKNVAFGIACFFAGVAGSFYAHYFYYICPYDFTFNQSLHIILYTVFGGVRTIVGPIVGVSFLAVLMEALHLADEYSTILFGVALIVVMLFMPEGLIDLGKRLPIIKRAFQKKEAEE